MRIINSRGLSDRGNLINEDIFNIEENAAWVLDGATGLTKSKISNLDTDAAWYVDKWNKYLKENINNDSTLKEIMRQGILEIKKAYEKFDGFYNLTDLEYPCAAGAIVRIKENKLEYFVLGDCTLIFKNKRQNAKELYNKELERLENRILENIIKIKNEKDINILDAKKICIQDIKDTRLLKNKEEGYWILELDENAVEHALTGELKIEESASVCMVSDGFSQYYDTLNIEKDSDSFIKLVKERRLEELVRDLRKTQENDSLCNKYPRFKKGDDSTIVYLEIEK